MIINDDKISRGRDMFQDIRLTDCPFSSVRVVAERILEMLNVGRLYSGYHTVTDLDRMIVADYWLYYDDLPLSRDFNSFKGWFMKMATMPDEITRARRWLVENRYIIVPTDVLERAKEAEQRYKREFGDSKK